MKSTELARAIRRSALGMVHVARASHIGSALSIADILAVLYAGLLRHEAGAPSHGARDRFILSKGHACSALYAALTEVGFFPREMLAQFGENFSPLMTHVSHHVPGVEFSTGSLGHGLPFGVGKALAAQRTGQSWRTYVLLSDGELDEGSNWEAMLFAAHHKLSNLIAIVDYNQLQSLATTAETLALEPLPDKLKAFGWEVAVIDGHNHSEIETALSEPGRTGPKIVVANTVKGRGVSFMEGKVEWHYRSPGQAELAAALAELGGERA